MTSPLLQADKLPQTNEQWNSDTLNRWQKIHGNILPDEAELMGIDGDGTPIYWNNDDKVPFTSGADSVFSADEGTLIEREQVTIQAWLKELAEARAAHTELLEALRALFRECSMIHTKWGEGSNQKEANQAIQTARAILAKYPQP